MSGTPDTPAYAPHESAIDRVIAKPGISLSMSQTQSGPFNSPLSVQNA